MDLRLAEKITPDDFIEIYSKDWVQLFRTLNLSRLMSYSVETLLSSSFEDLFERDERHTSLIVQAAGKIITDQQSYLEDFCPTHVVSEKYGKRNAVQMPYKFMRALPNSKSKEVCGILVSEIIEPLPVLQ